MKKIISISHFSSSSSSKTARDGLRDLFRTRETTRSPRTVPPPSSSGFVSEPPQQGGTVIVTKQQYLLKVEITGSGQVKVTGKLGIIDCVKLKAVANGKYLETCSAKIDRGESVALLAIPNEGYKFVFWSGRCEPKKDTMTADQNPKICDFTMNEDKTAKAVFEKKKHR